MPARSFRIVISNKSGIFTLNQSFNHLCEGDYTTDWLPPGSIPPGMSGGIQGESAGSLTGTEGYVKYNVDGPDGNHGMIYVYWDNPWWGITHFRFMTARGDVLPDCDYSVPAGGSVYSDQDTLDFTLKFVGYDHSAGDPQNSITTLGGLTLLGLTAYNPVAGIVTGLAQIAGTTGIDPNPELDLELDYALNAPPVSPPLIFGQSKTPAPIHQLLTNATPSDWVGNWRYGDNLGVDIELQNDQLTATVYDQTVHPALQFTETFVPGPTGLLADQAPTIQNLVAGQAYDLQQRKVFTRAAQSVIELAMKTSLSVNAASSHFQALAAKSRTSAPNSVSLAKARTVGHVIGVIIQNRGGVAYLTHYVVLMLFGIFEADSGKRTGTELHYQRLNLAGEPIANYILTTERPLQ